MAQTDYFESYGAVKTYLVRAINHPLSAAANFLQQLVVAEFGWNLCGVLETAVVAGGYSFIQKRCQSGLKETQAAKSLRRVCKELAPASAADTNFGRLRH